ncbi:MAG: type VI secretion system baseplate subunit TssF [Minicystis sp.]
MAQDALDKAFLAELEALEKFRISYTGIYPSTPLSREDPDIRRLIEALAMFSARTRLAAEHSIDQSMLRVFRQHFPYLLDPSPAMVMLSAVPTARYVDATELPAGTEVYLVERAGKPTPRAFRMRTQARLRILPLELDGLDIQRTRARTYRILFRFTADFRRNDDIGELNLYVNHLDDLASSIAVLYALKQHHRAASVTFEERINEETRGQPCEVYFGPPEGARGDLDQSEHPLSRVRSFMHCPWQELYINFKGIKPPRNWQSFTVILDMKDTWPTELRLTPDGFFLHVVPAVNVRQDAARPIETDGTKERHPLRHPDETSRYVLQRILGVYLMSAAGLVPLQPGVVGAKQKSWEVIYDGRDEARRAWLALNLPEAFDEPQRITVDAVWHQPSLRGMSAEDFRVKLADRFVDGVEWSTCGPLSAPADSALTDDRDGLLRLLSIKNQRFLGTDDLVYLAAALGATQELHFAGLISAIQDVTVTPKPFAKQSHGFKYVYELTFDDLDESDLPRLDLLCRRLLDALAAWSVEEVVEIEAKVKNLGRTLLYEQAAR